MNHPFEAILRKALTKSVVDDNKVLEEANALHKKGYKPEEIYPILKKIRNGLLRDKDIEMLDEVLEEFEQYMEE
jgi:uncharacterized protein YdaT